MDKFYRKVPIVEVRAMKDDDEKEDDDYVVRAAISSDVVDDHDTRMDISTTLPNFVKEANRGVPTMDSHNNKLGVGLTSQAMLKESIVLANLSVVRGVTFGADASYIDSDTLIRMIKKGVVREVSVGAYGGIFRCNICDRDMWRSWDCWHWPGVTYIIEEEGGDKKREVTCIPVIEDAHLGEVSFTYGGSNPDAKIMARAAKHAEDGLLSSKHITHINRMFGAGLDLRSANDKTQITGGFNSMDLEQAQTRITVLETENKTLKDTNTELEREVGELKVVSKDFESEKQSVRAEILKLYREARSDNITGEALVAYEKRLDAFDLPNLKIEKELLTKQVDSTDQDKQVEPGQQTNQDDKTQANPGGGAEAAMSRGLPPWAVARESE